MGFVRQFYPQARIDLGLIPSDRAATSENLIGIGNIRPKSVEVNHENIRTADTFTVEVAETRFPIDPRLIRDAVVDVHIADVESLDGVLDTDSPESRVLIGHADDVGKKFSNSGDFAKFKGRDYKGLLLDEEWQGRTPKLGRPLDEIVAEVLGGIPATSSLPVDVLLDGGAPVVPAGVGRKRGVFRAEADTPVLEALVTMALSVGVIVTVVHDRVVIQPPRSYSPQDSPTAFFALAKNVDSLEINRKLRRRDLPNVRVRAYDPATGKLVEGQHPRKFEKQPRAVKAKSKKSRTTTTNIREFPITHRAPTTAKLDAIAKQIHTRFAQQQLQVSLSTKDLRVESTASTEAFPETLTVSKLRNGGAIRVRLAPGEREVFEKALTADQREREARARGYSKELARVVARNWRVLDTPLFIDKASHSFDPDGGYEFSCEASAFVQVDI